MSETPAITAIAPWFGSKRTLAPRIVAELGEHRAYWEPFCGSMAVLLAKPPATMETVNDLHGDLVNLARVIQHPALGPALYRRLRRVWMSEVIHQEAAERFRERGNTPAGEQPDVDRAADYMLCAWLGRNGVAGTQSYNQGFCVRYTKNGGHGAKRWQGVVDSIPAWGRRLRAVTILSRDAFELIEKIEDAPGVVVYCDPPYIVKGAKYVHDFKAEDHQRLASLLMRFTKTRVVVSYYDHPDLAALYPAPRWTIVHCPTTKALVNQGMRDSEGGTVAPEVLLINGPSLTRARNRPATELPF